MSDSVQVYEDTFLKGAENLPEEDYIWLITALDAIWEAGVLSKLVRDQLPDLLESTV